MGNTQSIHQVPHIPPHSIEAEQSFLGAVILHPQCLDDVVDLVGESDFYHQNHSRIFGVVLSLFGKSKPIDVVTVSDELERNDLLEQVGGLQYVAQLANNTVGTRNVESYARIIREKAKERSLLIVADEIREIVYGPGDTKEKVDRSQAAILGIDDTEEETHAVPISEITKGVIDRLEYRISNNERMTGLPTGFDRLDKRTTGLQKGDLVIIAGRPSMGKTCLALNIAEHVSIELRGVAAVFSIEMSDQQLADRSICKLAEINNNEFKRGDIGDDFEKLSRITEAVATLSNVKLFFDETADISALQIVSRARKIKREHGLDLVVIDYLQLMNLNQKQGENQTAAIGRTTRQLKIAAKELDVPIILLSQLNRDLERRVDKRPVMADLRDSGSIEQDADIIWFVYRDEQYHDDTPDHGLAEIITAKFREGETGNDTLEFEGKFNRFRNTLRHAQARFQSKKKAGKQRGFQDD